AKRLARRTIGRVLWPGDRCLLSSSPDCELPLIKENRCRSAFQRDRNGENCMTIDPYSSSSIRDSVLELASSQLQNAHADVKSRNDHIHAAKEDYQAGDVKGAEEEQQAALSDQQNVLA